MVKTATANKAFTGVSGGVATEQDPWTTVADLRTGYLVDGNDQIYTNITIRESLRLESCSALNKNQCWQSDVSIPLTTWTTASPLLIQVNRHSSIIKKGSQLSSYVIMYSKFEGDPFTPLDSCSLPGTPSAGAPCVDYCEEVPLPTKPPTFMWSCKVKALDDAARRCRSTTGRPDPVPPADRRAALAARAADTTSPFVRHCSAAASKAARASEARPASPKTSAKSARVSA